MHVGRPDFYPFEKRLDAALAKAPVLALEIDPGLSPEVAARAMQKYAAAPPGMTAPPALAPRLAAALAAQGIPAEALASFKPWLVATVLSVGEFTRLGYSQADAVDVRLAQPRARAQGQGDRAGIGRQPDGPVEFAEPGAAVGLCRRDPQADGLRRSSQGSTRDRQCLGHRRPQGPGAIAARRGGRRQRGRAISREKSCSTGEMARWPTASRR